MKTKTLFVVYVLLVISYPLFAQKSVFKLDIEKNKNLAPLTFGIDEESLARAYHSSLIQRTKAYFNDEISEEYVSTINYGDSKVEDSYKLVDYFLRNYLGNEEDSVIGRIQIDVIFYNYEYLMTAGFFVNVFTLGIGYLVGIPNDKATTIVEIEAHIFDADQNLISRYSGYGKEVKRNGLYYKRKNQRFQNLDAMKKAIYSIHDQIQSDTELINSKLESALK